MNEINKDELLDLNKWQRFFFMVIYSFAINAVVNILIILAVLQSFFYLFTSRTNAQVQSVNNWLQVFFNDALNFLSFNTNAKPWPFNYKTETTDPDEEVDVVEGDSEEVQLDSEQPEQTTS